MVSRKTTKRLAGTAGATVAGGSCLIGLSRVAPISLAVLGATVAVLALVLAFAAYKLFDRWFRYLERRPIDSLELLDQQTPNRLSA